jgi:hypothetical protein
MQGVRRPIEALELINQGKVEGPLLQRVHRVKDSNNQKLFEVFRKECEQGSFWKA